MITQKGANETSSPTTTTVVAVPPRPGEVQPKQHPAEEIINPADELEKASRKAFGQRFAGVSAVDGELIVHVTDDTSTELPSKFNGYRVEIASTSYDALDAAKQKLDINYQQTEDQGFVLAHWGIDIAANSLSVAVVIDEGRTKEEAEAAISKLAPGVPISVEKVGALPVPVTRSNDQGGWGGSRIRGPMLCTSGISWLNQYGMNMMLTAGHCSLSTPALWWNGMGTSYPAWGNQIWNGMDGAKPWRNDIAALVRNNPSDVPYAGYLYNGGPSNCCGVGVSFWYSGSQANLTGVLTGGATTGEHQVDDGAVLAQNETLNYGGAYGTAYQGTKAKCKVQGGDSGGPVYRVYNGAIAVMGIINAKPGAGESDEFTRCWYTPLSVVYAGHGGAPVGM